MCCSEIKYLAAMGYTDPTSNRCLPLPPPTDQEQEEQWASRRARAYQNRDKAAKAIKYFSQGPDDICVKHLADAHRDHGLHSADIVTLDHEGRERGWLKDVGEENDLNEASLVDALVTIKTEYGEIVES
jgi:hypothetical protein